MAVRAVGIQIGPRSVLDGARVVIQHRQAGQAGQLGFIQLGSEQPKVIPRPQLIVRDAGSVGDVPIHLAGLQAEHAASLRVVALQAILAAGVVPGLHSCPTRCRTNGNLLGQTRAQQVRVAVVRPPLIDHAVDSARVISHEQARLEPALHVGMGFVDRELERFDEHDAVGKRPLAGRGEADLLLRHGNPANLVRAIGPERHTNLIRDQPVARRQCPSVLERAGLG